MNRALEDIKEDEITFDKVLVDGNKLIKGYNGKQEFVIKGDAKSLSIAAASIIAKVTRDRIMMKYAEKYPEDFLKSIKDTEQNFTGKFFLKKELFLFTEKLF